MATKMGLLRRLLCPRGHCRDLDPPAPCRYSEKVHAASHASLVRQGGAPSLTLAAWHMESLMTTPQYTVGMTLPVHRIQAHNNATASANKIHDDAVAAQYGFRGGLVQGVTVYAYMTYPLVQSFGEAW